MEKIKVIEHTPIHLLIIHLFVNAMIPISYPSPRVSQLDANILDNELDSLLAQQLSSVFHLQSSKWWSYSQQPEIWNLLLNLLVFKLTVWKSGASYGLSLQNLKLTDFRSGKNIGKTTRALLLGAIVSGFLLKKLESYLYSSEDKSVANPRKIIDSVKNFIYKHRFTVLSKVNDTFKVLNLANFVLFLISGRYPTLLHRVLGISLTPIVSDLLKFNGDNVNFEFQNRQLVWNVMTEFLVFILPLLQLKKMRKMAHKMLYPYKKDSAEFNREAGTIPVETPYSHLPLSQCAICHHNAQKDGKKSTDTYCLVTNPYVTNCGHVFCYVCLATTFNSIENGDDDSEPCLRCGMKLTWFEEYGRKEEDIDTDAIMVTYEDVDEEEEREEESDDEAEGEKSQIQSEVEDVSEEERNSEDEYSEGEEFDADDYDDDDDMDEAFDM